MPEFKPHPSMEYQRNVGQYFWLYWAYCEVGEEERAGYSWPIQEHLIPWWSSRLTEYVLLVTELATRETKDSVNGAPLRHYLRVNSIRNWKRLGFEFHYRDSGLEGWYWDEPFDRLAPFLKELCARIYMLRERMVPGLELPKSFLNKVAASLISDLRAYLGDSKKSSIYLGKRWVDPDPVMEKIEAKRAAAREAILNDGFKPIESDAEFVSLLMAESGDEDDSDDDFVFD